MENNNEKVSNEKLEKVSGGFQDLFGFRRENFMSALSKEEYKFLVDEGYISDGKLTTTPQHAMCALSMAGYKLEEEENTK